MIILVIKGYKNQRDMVPVEGEFGAHDVYQYPPDVKGDGIESVIDAALTAANLTIEDVISVAVIPSPANGRDPGSNDYHIFCRGQ